MPWLGGGGGGTNCRGGGGGAGGGLLSAGDGRAVVTDAHGRTELQGPLLQAFSTHRSFSRTQAIRATSPSLSPSPCALERSIIAAKRVVVAANPPWARSVTVSDSGGGKCRTSVKKRSACDWEVASQRWLPMPPP